MSNIWSGIIPLDPVGIPWNGTVYPTLMTATCPEAGGLMITEMGRFSVFDGDWVISTECVSLFHYFSLSVESMHIECEQTFKIDESTGGISYGEGFVDEPTDNYYFTIKRCAPFIPPAPQWRYYKSRCNVEWWQTHSYTTSSGAKYVIWLIQTLNYRILSNKFYSEHF